MSNLEYLGKELDIFAQATGWKRYFSSIITPYIGERVLEVGAGIGTTTAVLCNSESREWLCLEPDPSLLKILDKKLQSGDLPAQCRTSLGTIQNLDQNESFDTILYIDVMEHIENDYAEAQLAANRLNPGGTLIVLSPAHQWLFTPFDQAIGHYRRYSKSSLAAIRPSQCKLEKLIYLDSAGMLLSLGNRLLLNQSMPTIEQIKFWDRRIVPISRSIDTLLGFRIGKSIVAIWKKL
jgi:ubiquinone/menaquinone biosynthesis C-methylase UbiE